jgi:hypothetical protein
MSWEATFPQKLLRQRKACYAMTGGGNSSYLVEGAL